MPAPAWRTAAATAVAALLLSAGTQAAVAPAASAATPVAPVASRLAGPQAAPLTPAQRRARLDAARTKARAAAAKAAAAKAAAAKAAAAKAAAAKAAAAAAAAAQAAAAVAAGPVAVPQSQSVAPAAVTPTAPRPEAPTAVAVPAALPAVPAAVTDAVSAALPAAAPAGLGLPVNAAELSPAQLERVLDMARTAGATSISSGAVWWFLTERGGARSYDWSTLDRLVAEAAERGLQVNLQLSGTPDFVHPSLAAGQPVFWERIWHAPRTTAELQAWSAFVTDAVTRYGTRVARYEMWNEPNLPEFWKTGPKPAEYAALLRAGYLAAKAVDPRVTVTSAGLSRNDVGFASAMYDALAAFPGATTSRHFFDELGVHPYSDDRAPDVDSSRWVYEGAYGEVDANFLGLKKMVALTAARGEADKKVYVGEYGFSTTRTWMAAVPDEVRAQHARKALALVRTLPQVSAMVWYHFVPTSTDDAAWTMATADGGTSATYRALVEVARGA